MRDVVGSREQAVFRSRIFRAFAEGARGAAQDLTSGANDFAIFGRIDDCNSVNLSDGAKKIYLSFAAAAVAGFE